MILSFRHKHPKEMGTLWNQPTFFPEKILQHYEQKGDLKTDKKAEILKDLYKLTGIDNSKYLNPLTHLEFPKVHTIREDSKDRWKVGMQIHFRIFNRDPKSFEFYLGEVISIQKFEVRWFPIGAVIIIDDKVYYDGTSFSSDSKKIEALSKRDGFLGKRSFLTWFNSDFEGKLIHWTDLKY